MRRRSGRIMAGVADIQSRPGRRRHRRSIICFTPGDRLSVSVSVSVSVAAVLMLLLLPTIAEGEFPNIYTFGHMDPFTATHGSKRWPNDSADRPVISSKELRQYQSEVDKQAQKFFKKGAGTATPGDGFGMSAAAAETSFDVFASHDRPIPHGAVIRTVWFGGNEGRDSEPTYYMMSMPQFSPEVLPGLIKMSLVPMQVVTNKIPIEVKSSAGYKKNQKKMPEFLSPTQAASYAYRQPSSDEYYEYDNAYYEGTNEIYDDGGDSSKYTEPKKLMSYPGPMPEFITASERPASSPAHRPPVYTRPGGKGNDAKAQLYYDDFPEENENETGRQIVSEAKVNSYYYKPFSDSPSRRRSGNRFYYRYPKSQPQSHPSMSVHFR